MKRSVRHLSIGVALWALMPGCGDSECDSIEDQIMEAAARDTDLESYNGVDRRNNPCDDPVPVTATTDYRPACRELADCRD